MRPKEDINKRIGSVPVNTNAERDKQVLNDVLYAWEKSREAQSAAPQPNIWRIIMKSNIAKLTAAAVIAVVLVGTYQLGGARAAFAQTTRAVMTGLAGLKEFILDMRTREPQPPDSVPPAEPGKQNSDVQGKRLLANVRVFSVEAGQENLRDFFEREGIELAPAGNNPNTWYAKLDPGKTERFIELTNTAGGIKLQSSPSVMLLEGQEGTIGIIGGEKQDAIALALVGTVPDNSGRIELSVSFLHGERGFEIPNLEIGKDEAVLFRLAATDPTGEKDRDNPDGEKSVLVLIRTKVFSPA
jgi:hypothetical protein